MRDRLIRFIVRSRFKLSSAARVSAQIRADGERYLALAEHVGAARGMQPVEVPSMLGVDEDMRHWSFFMLLEHNAIVNRGITSLVGSLVRGEVPEEIDMKQGVMPSGQAGVEQVEAFKSSIDAHVTGVQALGKLRGGATNVHPIFGVFDAHSWHCMFGFHLKLHMRQAEIIAGVSPRERGR